MHSVQKNDSGPSVSIKDDNDQENRSADDATKQIVAQQSHSAVGIASTPEYSSSQITTKT